jgi:hypothetical protein
MARGRHENGAEEVEGREADGRVMDELVRVLEA